MQRVRFCSSGTEAVLTRCALHALTGRGHIAKFEGAYHGIDDPGWRSATCRPSTRRSVRLIGRTRALVCRAGAGAAESVVVLPLHDADACETILRENAADLAAVIIDPLSTATGLSFRSAFLHRLRAVTRELGILLIFDEIVSFRLSMGGTQGAYEIDPDLTCLAKVIPAARPAARLAAGKM